MKSHASSLFVLAMTISGCSGKTFGDPIVGDDGGASSSSSGSSGAPAASGSSSSGASGASTGGGTTSGAPPNGGPATSNVAVLASGQTSPHAIATDGAFVYWVESDSIVGGVAKVAVDGGDVVYLATNQSTADADQIALDHDNVYLPVDGYVMRVPIGVKAPIVGMSIANAVAPAHTNAVASDGTAVYWAELTDGAHDSITIRSAPRAGGDAATLGSATSYQWRNALAVDAARVYVTPGAELIAEVAKTGGATTTLPVRAESLAVDGGYVYFTNAGEGTVSKMPLAGGARTTLAEGQLGPWQIAVDDTSVYWGADEDGGSIMKVSKQGGSPVQLAKGYGEPRAIAVDGKNVYWTDPGHGRILRVAK
jgi:hypothetical protein